MLSASALDFGLTVWAHSMSTSHFIGLMSGTSLDGVDGVLARLDSAGQLEVLAHDFVPFARTPSTPSKEVPDMRPMKCEVDME